LEKDEDRSARVALGHLHGRPVVWHVAARRRGSGGGGVAALSSFVSGALGLGGGGGTSGSAGGDGGRVLARLVVRDSADRCEPEIFVDPVGGSSDSRVPGSSEGDEPSSDRPSPEQSGVGYKLGVALRRVDRVALDGEDQIVLLARRHPSDPRDQPPKELLRFVALSSVAASRDGSDSEGDGLVRRRTVADALRECALPKDERNMLVHHISVLVEWERQRRLTAGEDDGDDDDGDSNAANFLTARARKAAHFAHRELELQRTKRERDQRKAQLVSASGGLKYTALAMANRDKGGG
jgi:hypothetical protein